MIRIPGLKWHSLHFLGTWTTSCQTFVVKWYSDIRLRFPPLMHHVLPHHTASDCDVIQSDGIYYNVWLSTQHLASKYLCLPSINLSEFLQKNNVDDKDLITADLSVRKQWRLSICSFAEKKKERKCDISPTRITFRLQITPAFTAFGISSTYWPQPVYWQLFHIEFIICPTDRRGETTARWWIYLPPFNVTLCTR